MFVLIHYCFLCRKLSSKRCLHIRQTHVKIFCFKSLNYYLKNAQNGKIPLGRNYAFKRKSGRKECNPGHGRIENRQYYLCTNLSWLKNKDEWSGLHGGSGASAIRTRCSASHKKFSCAKIPPKIPGICKKDRIFV